jgi:hypothetical protein
VRYQPDDLDLAAEEAAEAQRLSSLLPQLQDAAQREGGGRRRRSGKGGDDDEVGGWQTTAERVAQAPAFCMHLQARPCWVAIARAP